MKGDERMGGGRVRCSLPWDVGRAARGAMTERSVPAAAPSEDSAEARAMTPRALTYRDVRKEARRLADRLASDFARDSRETYLAAAADKMHSNLQVAVMRREEERAYADKAVAHDLANALVSGAAVDAAGEERERAEGVASARISSQ